MYHFGKCTSFKRSFIINSLKTIPIIIEIVRTTNKIDEDFFISFKAKFFIFIFIAFETIGNRAIEVAIANIARGN